MQQSGLGEFIKQRRREIGISSQEELAYQSDTKQETISRLERDLWVRSPLPPPDVVSGIAKALRVTEAELLRAAGYLTDSIAAKRLDDNAEDWSAEQERLALSMLDTLQRDIESQIDALRRQVMPDDESDGDHRQRSLGGL